MPVLFNFKDEDMKWVHYKPKARMRVLDKIFPDGIQIPDYFFGKNIVHLPTMKCHIYTTTTGAMKNAFGGLLSTHRHYTHSWIHETLVDLLAIQKEIHSGLFAIMDGTTAGNGPGPRTMFPVVKNFMLASSDQVAIDAVVGQDDGLRSDVPRRTSAAPTRTGSATAARRTSRSSVTTYRARTGASHVGKNLMRRLGGDLIWFGPLKRFQKLFFHTPLVHIVIAVSEVYHDYYRWGFKDSRSSTSGGASTDWGQLFDQYVSGPPAFMPPPSVQATDHRTRVKLAGGFGAKGLGRSLALAAAAGALFYVGFAAYSGLPQGRRRACSTTPGRRQWRARAGCHQLFAALCQVGTVPAPPRRAHSASR